MSAVTDHLSPRAREILAVAREQLEDEGVDRLSMRSLGERLGMKAPSLYKHFASKEALEAALISIGFEEQAALFGAALSGSREPLVALGSVYREFAKNNPQLFRLMYDRGLNRALLFEGSEDAAAGPAILAAGEDQDLARAAWALAHGMTTLELAGRFPEDADVDAAWRRGMTALESAVRR